MTPPRPVARFATYTIPAAADGPALLNAIVPLTRLEAIATGGSDTAVVTSANGETALVAQHIDDKPWLQNDMGLTGCTVGLEQQIVDVLAGIDQGLDRLGAADLLQLLDLFL